MVGKRDLPSAESPILFASGGTQDEIRQNLTEALAGEPPKWQTIDMWECATAARALPRAASVDLGEPPVFLLPTDSLCWQILANRGQELEKLMRPKTLN